MNRKILVAIGALLAFLLILVRCFVPEWNSNKYA